MDWSKIMNDCQTWKKAGRIWLHGNGWLTSTKTQVWTKEKALWGRVLVVTAVTTNCDILPSSTKIPLTALTLAMHGWSVMTIVGRGGGKKRKWKKNFAWWKENSNFSLSYSVLNLRCRSHSTLVQNQTTGHFTSGFEQEKKNPWLKFTLGFALIKLGTSEPRPMIWWQSSVCCLELGDEQFWPARTLRYTVSDLRVRVRRHLCPYMVMTSSQYILSQLFLRDKRQFTRLVPKPSY